MLGKNQFKMYGYQVIRAILVVCSLLIGSHEALSTDETEPTVWDLSSLIVTKHEVLDALNNSTTKNDSWDMGYLLGKFAQYEIGIGSGAHSTVGEFVDGAFQTARGYQDRYEAHSNQENYSGKETKTYFDDFTMIKDGAGTLGGLPDENKYIDRVLDIWRDTSGNSVSRSKFRGFKKPLQLMGKNFRMLAITNRMDLAGDFDDRISANGTKVPRYLGEIHLIYGVIDREYEKANDGKPYPSVFVLSYRLPPLKTNSQGYIVEATTTKEFDPDDDSTSEYYDAKFENKQMYKKLGSDHFTSQMKMWANLWVGLSKVSRNTQTTLYRKRLKNILRLAVQPHNFLSMKSNTEINDEEFELREWYMFKSGQGQGALIARFPRREPYRCLDGSSALNTILDNYWVEEEKDFDVSTKKIGLTRSGLNDGERAGFAILRNNHRPLLSVDDYIKSDDDSGYPNYVGRSHDITPASKSRDGKHYFGTRFWKNSDCGKYMPNMPFAMLSGPSRRAPIMRDQSDRDKNLLMMLAPFARVSKNDSSKNIWKMNEIEDDLEESKRHLFGIRTCSGCHSQEGGTMGFHVFPREKGKNSKLSGFLTGKKDSFNPFKYAGRTYNYDQIEQRKQFLIKAYLEEVKLNEGLRRPMGLEGYRE